MRYLTRSVRLVTLVSCQRATVRSIRYQFRMFLKNPVADPGHYIENIGDEPLVFLEIFNTGVYLHYMVPMSRILTIVQRHL